MCVTRDRLSFNSAIELKEEVIENDGLCVLSAWPTDWPTGLGL
jgi:hypothetical protein